MRHVRGGRARQHIDPEESRTVLFREEHIYARKLDELMELFRAMQQVLDDLGFDDIHEEYAEHWETLPFKNGVEAYRWKDPYTALMLDISARVKEPRTDRKTDEDVYKVKLKVTAKVISHYYPHGEHVGHHSMFQKSVFYKWIRKILDSVLFNKEKAKYEEEAEELAIEFVSRMREIEGTMPAIGRTKREWYNPDNPR